MQIVLVEPNKAARPVEIEDNLHAMQALVGRRFRPFIRGRILWRSSAMTRERSWGSP